tara:strand:- start:26 stop:658 length:633 start_codon:yes stop_codon:yes gene_type:complete
MKDISKRLISGLIYILIMWYGVSYELSYILLFSTLGILSLYEMWKLRRNKSKIIAFSFIIIPFILIQFIGNSNFNENIFNPSIVLFMLLLTWTFDSFAFLLGIKFGKNKMAPKISPKKSWEGFFGGYIFTIIISYFTYSFFNFEEIKTPLIISMILPVTATTGDLTISFYKRQAKVKDSGTLIPGHGGILDRMDAFMITIPSIYIIINFL